MYALLISLLFCHFLADYCFTSPHMLEAKTTGKKLQYIVLHSLVHAALMSIVLLVFGIEIKTVLLLFSFELTTHFIIDYLKGLFGRLFPDYADNSQKSFWMLYGFDQLLHLLVIVAMVYYTATP